MRFILSGIMQLIYHVYTCLCIIIYIYRAISFTNGKNGDFKTWSDQPKTYTTFLTIIQTISIQKMGWFGQKISELWTFEFWLSKTGQKVLFLAVAWKIPIICTRNSGVFFLQTYWVILSPWSTRISRHDPGFEKKKLLNFDVTHVTKKHPFLT